MVDKDSKGEQVQQPEQVQKGVDLFIPEGFDGKFANFLMVAHTPEEFLMDFFFVSGKQGFSSARIIVTPAHMKRIAKAISENLKNYEEKYGTIPETAIKHTEMR